MEKQDFYKLIDALNYVSLTEHLFVTTRSEFEILSVQLLKDGCRTTGEDKNINPDHELLTALGTLTIKGVEVFFVELK
jgi:hypothetical protein